MREEIDDLPEVLRKSGVESVGWRADVSNPSDVRRVVDGARDAFGGIDLLVNNAGACSISTARDDLDKSLADYDQLVGTNLKGEYLFGRAVIPILIEQASGGDIINIATDHMVTCGTPHDLCPQLDTCPWNEPNPEFAGPPRPTGGGDVMDLYDASKWGLNGLLYAWTDALRPHDIRVNAICPGVIDTPMTADVPKEILEPLYAATPLGRGGLPSDVASTALFLASDESSFITGQWISPNGGLVMC